MTFVNYVNISLILDILLDSDMVVKTVLGYFVDIGIYRFSKP